MDNFAQILRDIFNEKKTTKIIEDYDKNAMKKILQSNCIKTANEIIKIILKAIDDYANKKETTTGIFMVETFDMLFGKKGIQIEVTFSENDSKMIRDILTDKIPIEIIEKILADKYESASDGIWEFDMPRAIFLDKILEEQFKKLNFKYANRYSIMDIIKRKYISLIIYL